MENFQEFYQMSTSPEMVIFSIMVVISVCYWSIVCLGLLDIDCLNFDLEASTDLDGLGGVFDGMFGFLSVGMVPITIIFSFMSLEMWVTAYFIRRVLPQSWAGVVPAFVFVGLIILISGFIGLILAAYTVRPLRRVFENITTRGHEYLKGEACVIKSSVVTTTFGQAELHVDDSFLLIDVRCEERERETLKKGDDALVIGYNKEEDSYLVTLLDLSI